MSKKQSKRQVKNTKKSIAGLDQFNKTPMYFLLFFVLAFLIYGQALGFFLGKFDEDTIILGNLNLLKDFTNIKLAFTRDAFMSENGIQFYRPFQTITYFIDAHFFGLKGSSFYFTNIVLHALTCSGLFYLLILLNNNLKSSLVLTLLYLSSPLFVHAVVWIPSRGDLLIGFFGILSLVFFIKMISSQKFIFGLYTCLTFLAAMFSKETAILIPFLLIFYYFVFAKSKKLPLYKLLITFAGFLVIIIFYFYLRTQVIKVPASNDEFGITSFFYNIRTIPEYLAKFFIPFQLSPMSGFTILNTVTGILIFALLIFLTLRFSVKPFKKETFGLIWFLLFVIPGLMYSHQFGSSAYDYLEHRSYLPMIGVIILISSLYNNIKNVKIHNRLATIIVLFSVFLGVYSFIYANKYENPMTFYNHTISSNPKSAMALSNRGLVKAEIKDYKGAIEDYDKALALKHDYSRVFVNKGLSLAALNDMLGAIAQYDSAIIYEPALFHAHFNKANQKTNLGLYHEALKEYNISMELFPSFASGYLSRGIVQSLLLNYSAAENDFSKVIKLEVNNSLAYVNRGKMRLNLKNANGACDDWKMASDLGNSEAAELINIYCK